MFSCHFIVEFDTAKKIIVKLQLKEMKAEQFLKNQNQSRMQSIVEK